MDIFLLVQGNRYLQKSIAAWAIYEISKGHTPRWSFLELSEALIQTATSFIAVCCKQLLLWNSLSKQNSMTKLSSTWHHLSSFFPVINYHDAFSFLIVHPKRPLQHWKQQKIPNLIFRACFAVIITNGSTHIVLILFLRRVDIQQSSYFCFQV